MADIFNNTYWSQIDANNNQPSPDGFPEGMQAGALNNSSRALMGATKRWYDKANATMTTGGSTNAYTLTPTVALTVYTSGELFTVVSNHTNTGAATINISGLGAKAIKKNNADALGAGDIESGQIFIIAYDGTNFQLISQVATADTLGGFTSSDFVRITTNQTVAGVKTFSSGIDGVIGAVTPADGSFTTFSASGSATVASLGITGDFTSSGHIVLSTADITAAGTTQGTATALTKSQNRITSITAATAEAVVLPTGVAGMMIVVYNDDATDTLKVFPALGGTIDGNALNASVDLGSQTLLKFHAITSTLWVADYGVYG